MVDGQIIAAHIIYDQSAVPTALDSGQPKSENYIPKIYDDYIISGNTGHSSQHKPEEETSSALAGIGGLVSGTHEPEGCRGFKGEPAEAFQGELRTADSLGPGGGRHAGADHDRV